jgi:hypothetical protein
MNKFIMSGKNAIITGEVARIRAKLGGAGSSQAGGRCFSPHLNFKILCL